MPILYTPRTPAWPKILLAAACLLAWTSAKCQEALLLRPLADYEASLKAYHLKKWQVDRTELMDRQKKKWWYYLPTVGLQFGLPSVQFNTQTLEQWDRDKALTKARLAAIDARAELTYNQELLQLRTMYRKLEIELDAIGGENYQIMQRLHERIMMIHNDAFNDRKMTPLEHLTKNIQYRQQLEGEKAQIRSLQLKVLELEELAKYGMVGNRLIMDSLGTEVPEVRISKRRLLFLNLN